MKLPSFETEDYFAQYEFTKPFLISASDCESVSIAELIQLGGGSPTEFLQVRLGYPEMPGSQALRQKIASLYENLSADQVLVLGSPIEGIYLTMQALLEKGDHVVVLSPAYDALFNVAEHVSGNVSRWFLANDGKTWSLDFAQLEKLLASPTKLLVINFPHNPTGFLPTKAELKRLVEIADRHGVRIYADEIYRGLEYNPGTRLPSVAELSESAIVLSGASKSQGLPGLRFGWLATKDIAAYKKLLDRKTYTSMCSTQAGEYLGKMAIRASPKLIEKNLNIIRNNLGIAETFFAKWQGRADWLKPLAGSVSLIKLHEKSAEKFCHELANDFGVVLLPARFMGYEDHYARIGFGRTNFASGMEAFDKALSAIYR
ncbi:MAG: aminotransferase class I/II-fold pyridoxal phosphate-dependent enzyme [Bdellovibrionota bacterium]